MKTLNIQKMLVKALVGKTVAKQPVAPPNTWGKRITSVVVCSTNWGEDTGMVIVVDGADSFEVLAEQDFKFI